MRKSVTMLVAAAMLLGVASSAMGAVGWCGNIWPVNGTPYTSAENIGVYVQIWKEGVTDQAGQGADIAAYLYYRCTGDPDFVEVPMIYWGDVGSNDEYQGIIPIGHGCAEVEFYVKVVDLTDMAECFGQDQNGGDPNFFLPITAVTAQDVTVKFHLCLTEGIDSFFDVCVTGSGNPLTNWTDGVLMGLSCGAGSPKLYEVEILFPAGGNPFVEYKYKKDDCVTWEGTGNHSFMIDDSGPTMDLAVDGWEWNTPDCPDCASPVELSTWSTIKAIYR